MDMLRRTAARAARLPGFRSLRVLSGRFVSPEIRDQLKQLESVDADTSEHLTVLYHRSLNDNHRLTIIEETLAELKSGIDELQAHMPTVLNAISSTHGSARLLRRELDAVQASAQAEREEVARRFTEFDEHVLRLNGHIRDELWPLVAQSGGTAELGQTVRWLLGRVETVRAEMLHEIQYGGRTGERSIEVEIVNAEALKQSPLKLNLGCGHIPLEGFVNIDMRPLPGVDVVASVDGLPFDEQSVNEIFSAHVLEHFPQEQLARRLLPYWHSRLAPGGVFRCVVPDIDAMITQYRNGEISFDDLREVAYGGQEYDGDFHHTAFTPESMGDLLRDAGFSDVELIERGRVNGACLEFELSARRPA
jgi:predicted SAM-dependent methyltransferase